MIPALRQAFNRNFTTEKYRAFLDHVDRVCGTHIPFRICETPCFFPGEMLQHLAAVGRELIHELVDSAAYRAASRDCIPADFAARGETARPLFIQVDFGLVRNANGELAPRLVEIQAFASLYAYQAALSQAYIEKYALDPGLRFLLDFENTEAYRAELRRAIVGHHDPENVVLLEIEPEEQKTLADFLLTERMLGVRPVCITSLRREGKRLFYARDGKWTQIHRIYNRVIADELIRKRIPLPFHYGDDLEVEWAGHPNWFFRISKFSLPYLRHPCVPRTWFLDQLPPEISDQLRDPPGAGPGVLDNFVLKPLYSFAGLGVVVGPARDDLDKIPPPRRHDYILQERMRFEPVIETPHGPTQAEIRIMFLWPDALRPGSPAELRAGLAIVRMGRGKMMGVDHNRDLEWVGASAALFPSA
jgi:hypothetical protein